jgi:hypothetical protein
MKTKNATPVRKAVILFNSIQSLENKIESRERKLHAITDNLNTEEMAEYVAKTAIGR